MDDKLDAELEEARGIISRLRTEAADLHQAIMNSRAQIRESEELLQWVDRLLERQRRSTAP